MLPCTCTGDSDPVRPICERVLLMLTLTAYQWRNASRNGIELDYVIQSRDGTTSVDVALAGLFGVLFVVKYFIQGDE
jgi:hypothetical protein